MSRLVLWAAVLAACGVGGDAARAQTPLPPSPNDFALASIQSDQFEIEAARVAEVEGRDPRVKAFARQMIEDHSRAGSALRQAAAASAMPPLQPGMSSEQAALLSSLQSVRGEEFDRTYAHQQLLAHDQAAAVDESFAMAGADESLRRAAQSALPMIREHLRMAQGLRDQVGER